MARRRQTDMVVTTLRLRETLRRKLQRAAERNNQSLNIEMVDRLAASFEVAEVQVLLGMLIEQPEDATRLLTCVAQALQRSRGWKADLVVRETLRTAIGALVEACATGEVSGEIPEIPSANARHDAQANGIALAALVFCPREQNFRPMEEDTQ